MQRRGWVGQDTEVEFRERHWRFAFARVKFAIARLRQGLERKAGFNPDQPRDDHGRWTDTGGGGGQSIVQDTTGNEPWDHVVRDRRADGSLAQELVFNRDGSTIHSEFARAGDGLAWDERHTVVTTSGERIRFETTGEAQTITDANSGDVLGASRWTDAGPEPEATLQPVFDPRGYAAAKTIEAAALGLAVYPERCGRLRRAHLQGRRFPSRRDADRDTFLGGTPHARGDRRRLPAASRGVMAHGRCR